MTRIHAKRNADPLTGARGVSRVDDEDEQEHKQDQEQGETPWGAGAVNPVRIRMNIGPNACLRPVRWPLERVRDPLDREARLSAARPLDADPIC